MTRIDLLVMMKWKDYYYGILVSPKRNMPNKPKSRERKLKKQNHEYD